MISCPECSEQDIDKLAGEPEGDTIRITCGSCGHSWLRDQYRCPECGGRNVYDEKRPIYQKARGVQQSIIGQYTVQHCGTCGWTNAVGDAPVGYRKEDA